MTFEDLFQKLSALTPDERKSHDLTIYDLGDTEFYAVKIDILKVNDDDEDDPGAGILDHGHPYLTVTYK